VARYAINPDRESCEFVLVLADCMRGKGLGHLLMVNLMDVARSKGLKSMEGEVLNTNHSMLKLMERHDFTVVSNPEDDTLKTVRKLL